MGRRLVVLAALAAGAGVLAQAATAREVLRVGTYHGIRGQFRSVQAAVDAAKPGAWILIGPGDYKTSRSRHPRGRASTLAGILITTPGVWLRGMNRNTVVIDGTKPGSARCSTKAGAQNYGPAGRHGHLGLNGIMVWKAPDVWVQNLTACNFLSGSGDAGNGIWWNGGDNSGKVGGYGYTASYLTATSSFYRGEKTAAAYGIYSSNWSGGVIDRSYASNFSDSGFYIGACQQTCDQTLDHSWAEYDALGYSASNAGGQLVVENSQWDNNLNGINTDSQNEDNPPPQDGECPNGATSSITHTRSCTVFIHNYVHDNNDPNVPAAGEAAQGPVGTGVVIAGGRYDTVTDNTIVRNDAWGLILDPYIDKGLPCTGGTRNFVISNTCLFDDWGNAVVANKFKANGSYGHPTNGDLGYVSLEAGHPTNCFRANTEIGGGAIKPATAARLQAKLPNCTGKLVPAGASDPRGLAEGICDSGLELIPGQPPACPTGPYPRRTHVVLHPLPNSLPTMPNPCAGVPANPWCPARKGHKAGGG